MEIENAFVVRNKYRDIYEGYTWFTEYPKAVDMRDGNCGEDSLCKLKVEISTATTSGSLTSPWYKDNYDPNNFQYLADYKWHIYPPSNLRTITGVKPDLSLVLHFAGDLYVGQEWVKINNGEGYEEYFYNIGNLTKKYKTADLNTEVLEYYDLDTYEYSYAYKYKPITITLQRNIGPDQMKKDTGFVLEWYYEDAAGTKVDPQKHMERFGDLETEKKTTNTIFTTKCGL